MAAGMLFNTNYSGLFVPINRSISSQYYIATGISIEGARTYVTTLDVDPNDRDIRLNIKSRLPEICIIKCSMELYGRIKRVNDIMYINNRLIFLCFVPEEIIDDGFSGIMRIKILYNLFDYVIKNTSTDIDKDSIYGYTLKVLPEYLTVSALYLSFTGLEYEYFKEAFPEGSHLTQRIFTEILETDLSSIMNYAYIYALFYDR